MVAAAVSAGSRRAYGTYRDRAATAQAASPPALNLADGAAQPEAQSVKPVLVSLPALSGAQAAASLLGYHAAASPHVVVVDLAELDIGRQIRLRVWQVGLSMAARPTRRDGVAGSGGLP